MPTETTFGFDFVRMFRLCVRDVLLQRISRIFGHFLILITTSGFKFYCGKENGYRKWNIHERIFDVL